MGNMVVVVMQLRQQGLQFVTIDALHSGSATRSTRAGRDGRMTSQALCGKGSRRCYCHGNDTKNKWILKFEWSTGRKSQLRKWQVELKSKNPAIWYVFSAQQKGVTDMGRYGNPFGHPSWLPFPQWSSPAFRVFLIVWDESLIDAVGTFSKGPEPHMQL